jgi:hypothetical protein
MPMTNYLRDALLDASLKNTTYTSPANVYVALYSTVSNVTTSGTELTGNGYSRQIVTFNAAVDGNIDSNAAVTFTSSGNAWLPAVSVGITDASTAGNVLFFQNGVPRTVPAGETLTYATGDITISIS